MSLFYACKTALWIGVLSDSKLTIDDSDKNSLKSILLKEEYDNFINLGVIKTIIYHSSITNFDSSNFGIL